MATSIPLRAFNPSNLTSVRTALETALAGLSDSYGIQFDLGRITYDTSKFHLRLDARIEGAQSKEESALSEFDIKVGTEIPFQGQTVRIIGYRSRNRKYPFIVETLDSKTSWKVSEKAVLRKLENPKC